jgi:hypothetical protein
MDFAPLTNATVECGFERCGTLVEIRFSETLGFVKRCRGTATLDVLYLKTLS